MKIATLVQDNLKGWQGKASLYRLSHRLEGSQYVVVSAIDFAFDTGVSETLIFAADVNGRTKSMKELKGSQRLTTSHAVALLTAGYKIKGDDK